MTPSVWLSIGGEVERPACLSLAELRSLANAELVADFHCFLSVKSVDRIEVTHQPQQATAAAIALARLER